MSKIEDSIYKHMSGDKVKILDHFVIHSEHKVLIDNIFIIELIILGLLLELAVLLNNPGHVAGLMATIVLSLIAKIYADSITTVEHVTVFRARIADMTRKEMKEFEQKWIILTEISNNIVIIVPNPDYEWNKENVKS